MLRRLARFSAVLIGVLVIASLAFASATLTAAGSSTKSTTTLSIGSKATLGTGPFGPGASVSLTYSCFPGFGGKGGYGGGSFGSVSLTDLTGHQGFQGFSATCDDKKHNTTVFVTGFFSAGDGAASAFLCGFDCASTSREVKIS
jgi:hypothetical protein